MYEGAPNWPDFGPLLVIIEKHKVNIMYTAPTAIRTFIDWGGVAAKHDLSSLRLLGTVGEPINPEAWMWYRDIIGGDRCPIVDTWWQTETGAIMIAPMPARCLQAWIGDEAAARSMAEMVTREGEKVPLGSGGFLVIKKPWPSMLRTFMAILTVTSGSTGPHSGRVFHRRWGARRRGRLLLDHGSRRRCDQRFRTSAEHHGDRVGTGGVREGRRSGGGRKPDEMKGQACRLSSPWKMGNKPTPGLKEELRAMGGERDRLDGETRRHSLYRSLPKTRSGKIMRRLLRELASSGDVKGDTTTLEDFGVIASLKEEEA